MRYTDLYRSDLDEARTGIPGLDGLSGARVLITGATGLIGSALADALLRLNDTEGVRAEVWAAARSEARFRARFGPYADRPDFHFLPYDALEPLSTDTAFDFIVHAAGPSDPASLARYPVETMLVNLTGLHTLLRHGRDHGARRVLYLSTGEVYGRREGAEPYREEDSGYVDIRNPRACYPSAKRAAETLLAAYRAEYGLDGVTVRPGHIFGPTAADTDSHAAAQFLRNATAGVDIIMKSEGRQRRSWCYGPDCAAALLTVLLYGTPGGAYNLSGPDTVGTVRELADCAAESGGVRVVYEPPTDRERRGYNLMENSVLDPSALLSLGWRARFDLRRAVDHTVRILREQQV